MALLVLSDRPGFGLAAEGRWLPRREAAVAEQALTTVAAARAYATDLQSRADEAFEAGHRAGHAAGWEAAQRELAARLVAAEAARVSTLASLAPHLAEVALDALATLATQLDRQLWFAQSLLAVQSALRGATSARMRVHPERIAAARCAVESTLAGHPLASVVQLVADERVGLDGCLFESDFGSVDASLAVQLDNLRRSVRGAAAVLASPAPQ